MRTTVANLLVVTDEDAFEGRLQFPDCRDQTVALLESLRDNDNEDLAALAIELLARVEELDVEWAMPVLQNNLAEDSYYDRKLAAQIAASLGEAARPLVPRIIELLPDYRADDDTIPALAKLYEFMPEILEAIEEACGKANPYDLRPYDLKNRRVHALNVIAAIGPAAESTRETVEHCLADALLPIRNAAEQAIASLDGSGGDDDDTQGKG